MTYTKFSSTWLLPAHEIKVIITNATSEGSGEPAQSRQSHRCYRGRRRVRPKIIHLAPTGWLRMRVWKMSFTEDEKCHNHMRWLNLLFRILFYRGFQCYCHCVRVSISPRLLFVLFRKSWWPCAEQDLFFWLSHWVVLYLMSRHEKKLFVPYRNNNGADQPVHPRSLISAFVVRCLDRKI